MMPSRGLRLIKDKLPCLKQLQCRKLSSTPLRSPSHTPFSLTRKPGPWHRASPSAIVIPAAARHASTAQPLPPAQTTATPTSPPPAPASPPAESTAFPNLDTITLDNINLKDPALDISNIPEGIGYLKQIGIEYGYGPTSGIEWILEHVHIWGGLPWWGSIAATAVIIRVAIFPLFLKSSDIMARQAALVSVTKPVTDRMTAAQRAGNTQEVMLAWRQLGAIRKRAGISMPQQLAPLLLQGVIGYCGFKLMRACSTLPVPGFHDGGFLWLQDLTLTDGYLLMPIIMAGTIHLVVRLGGETGAAANTLTPGMKKLMMYGMPSIVALVTVWQPGAVCVWFAASGFLGIIQGQALQRPGIRSFFRLAPLHKPAAGDPVASNPFTAMLQERTENYTSKLPSSSKATPANINVASMRPTYQEPSLNRQASNRVIDTTLVTPQSPRPTAPASASATAPASDMIQPSARPTSKKYPAGEMNNKPPKKEEKGQSKRRATKNDRSSRQKGR